MLGKAATGYTLEARVAINEALDPSVVDHAKLLIDDVERLRRRIEEIQATLKAASIEI